MASPAALLRIAYFAVIFTQVCSSPFWSQPDCLDQDQSGYWSSSDYESQGPSYQQTLQAMVSETIRCVQQVIQVTKREMILLLRQLAQDADCSPSGNTQAVSYGDVNSGQIRFPAPDSRYNYDRPQQQLQYPAQYHSSDPLIQPPIEPQVQIRYHPQVHQEIPQNQPQYLPNSPPVLNTDSYVVNCNREHADHPQEVSSSTVENKISSSGTHETSPASTAIAYTKTQTHANESVERPIMLENDNTSNTNSEGIQVQTENGLLHPNSNLSNTLYNIPTLNIPHSDYLTSTVISHVSHDSMDEYNVADSTPVDTSTHRFSSTEKAPLNDEVENENGALSSNNPSTINLTNIPILIHGAPISLSNVTSTTARNDNTTENNHSKNTLMIPSPMNNEVDVNIENVPEKNSINDTNKLSSNDVTTQPMPVEKIPSNSSEINMATLKYKNSVESTDGNAYGPQQNKTLETTTQILVDISTVGNSTDQTATEITGESGSTLLTIDKHDESNVTTTNSTDATVMTSNSKL